MLTPDELEHKEYLAHAIATMQDQLNSLRAKERKNRWLRIKLFLTYIKRARMHLHHKAIWSYFWMQAKENAIWDGVEWWHRY